MGRVVMNVAASIQERTFEITVEKNVFNRSLSFPSS